MDIQEFKKAPTGYQILMAFCLVFSVYLVFSFFQQMQYSHNLVRSVIQLVLWVTVTIGFSKTQKWSWIVFSLLMVMSILIMVHGFITLKIPFNPLSSVSIVLSILLIGGLNMKSVRELFRVDSRKTKESVHATNFSILCSAIGLYVFIEILSGRHVTINPTPVNLFIGFIGFIFILLGIYIWRMNPYAIQAVLPFLAFTVISIAIVLVLDIIGQSRVMVMNKFIFYMVVSIAMLVYWAKCVQPKIS